MQQAADTIASRLQRNAARFPEESAYFRKIDGQWVCCNWRQYAEQVRAIGKALIVLGFEPGDIGAILAANSPEWVLFDLACMSIGGAAAGVYLTSSANEAAYVLQHAEARVLFAQSHEHCEKVHQQWAKLPKLKHIVTLSSEPYDDPRILSWHALLEKAKDVSDADFDSRLAALKQDQLATLIYTSGTTGKPKAVMLSHHNLAWTAQVACKDVQVSRSDIGISYLPLSHVAEQMFSIYGPITTGCAVYFAESIEKLKENLVEVRPTYFLGMPRVWEKFHAAIREKLSQAKGFRLHLVNWAMAVGREVNKLRNENRRLPMPLRLRYEFAKRLIFDKFKKALGFDRTHLCVSGAAPISVEILEFFAGFDLAIRETYGQSEDTGPSTLNIPGRTRFGTVGPAFSGTEIRIAEDGEVLVKGPNVFLGYYKDPEATKACLDEGWMHSGDIGEFDNDGFLKITGRKKEIIITAGGKNVAPAAIEGSLKTHVPIGDVVIIGDRRKYLVALITVDEERSKAMSRESCEQAVQRAVDRVNSELARVEQIKRFCILSRPFSIERGELTPTLKIKRNVVEEHFKEEIEAMYR